LPEKLKNISENQSHALEEQRPDADHGVEYGGRMRSSKRSRNIAEKRARPVLIPRYQRAGHLAAPLDAKLPDPDVLIRTSGEMRISNFSSGKSPTRTRHHPDALAGTSATAILHGAGRIARSIAGSVQSEFFHLRFRFTIYDLPS